MAEDVAMSEAKVEGKVKPEAAEDEVVAELEVYISQNLAQQLYLLQYPLRPPWRPYESSQMTSAKIKPSQQRVEMQFAIDTKSDHYDLDSSHKAPTQVLNSTRIDSRTTYAVAALRGDQLHLTPIHGGILQFRPSFAHLDAADAEQKKAEEEDVAPVHDEEDGEDEGPKALTVQFKRRENERSAAARKQSHAFLKQEEEKETWVDLKRHTRESTEGMRMFERLFTDSENAVKFDLSAEQYISRLMPTAPAAAPPALPAGAEEAFSLASLARLPLDMQLRSLFSSAYVAHYQRIKALCTAARTDDELLGALSHAAVLVRGVWVARSDLLYLDNAKLARAHDLLLLALHEKGKVENRKAFSEGAGLNAEESKQILIKVAALEPNTGWVLKLQPDNAFVSNFPQVIASFNTVWANKKKHLSATPDVEMHRSDAEPMNVTGPGSNLPEQLHAFMKELLNHYGVCSLTLIKKQLDSLRTNDSHPYSMLKDPKPIDQDLLLRTLKSIALTMHNAWYLRSTGSAEHDKYREVILNVFKDKVAVKKTDIAKAAEEALGETIPTQWYSKVLKEFAYAKGSQWIFKSGNNGNQ